MKNRSFIRISMLFLCLSAGLPLCAQQEDSLRVRHDSLSAVFPPQGISGGWAVPQAGLALPRVEFPAARPVAMPRPAFTPVHPSGLYLPYVVNPSPMFRGDYRTDGVLDRMAGGYWVGSGGQTSVPGIGRFNAASLGWQKQFGGRLQLQLMADALKMNTARFTGQSFGLSGQLLWQAQDKLYVRTFGGVGFGDFSTRPSYGMGGALGFDITERFGLEMGAQTFYNNLTGRWEVLPIVAPYYKFDKFKLQIDVGPLIRELIRGAIYKHRGGGSGPTIMPDVPGFKH